MGTLSAQRCRRDAGFGLQSCGPGQYRARTLEAAEFRIYMPDKSQLSVANSRGDPRADILPRFVHGNARRCVCRLPTRHREHHRGQECRLSREPRWGKSPEGDEVKFPPLLCSLEGKSRGTKIVADTWRCMTLRNAYWGIQSLFDTELSSVASERNPVRASSYVGIYANDEPFLKWCQATYIGSRTRSINRSVSGLLGRSLACRSLKNDQVDGGP